MTSTGGTIPRLWQADLLVAVVEVACQCRDHYIDIPAIILYISQPPRMC